MPAGGQPQFQKRNWNCWDINKKQFLRDFVINPKIALNWIRKQKCLNLEKALIGNNSRAIAFGSLLDEGHRQYVCPRRCWSGNFPHRHAIMYDQENENKFIPLKNISEHQAAFGFMTVLYRNLLFWF